MSTLRDARSSPWRLLLNRWSLQLAATVGLVAFALGRVDLREALNAISQADYGWSVAALATLTGSKLLAAARWRLYLKKVGRPPLLGLMGAYVIGTMVNTLLPLRSGDFAKIQIIAARYHLPRAAISSSVFAVEAVLDALTLLLLFLISMAILDLDFIPDAIVFLFIAGVGGGFLAAVLTSRFMPHEMPAWRWLAFLNPRAREILAEAWPKFLDGMVTLRDGRLFVQAMSLHVIEWLMRAAVLGLLSASFALDVEPTTYVILTIAVAIFTLFPVTFFNIGTYQVVVTEIMVASGASRDDAFAFAIASHAISHLWIVVMGLSAAVLMQVRRHEISADTMAG